MPDAITSFNDDLEPKTHAELTLERDALHKRIASEYTTFDDAPIDLLHRLLAITRMLRRKTAGPPKAAKPKTSSKADPNQLLSDL